MCARIVRARLKQTFGSNSSGARVACAYICECASAPHCQSSGLDGSARRETRDTQEVCVCVLLSMACPTATCKKQLNGGGGVCMHGDSTRACFSCWIVVVVVVVVARPTIMCPMFSAALRAIVCVFVFVCVCVCAMARDGDRTVCVCVCVYVFDAVICFHCAVLRAHAPRSHASSRT